MAFGVNHVAGAPSRGEAPGARPLPPPPYTPTQNQRIDGEHGLRRRSTPDGAGLRSPETGSPGLVREEPGVDDHARRRTPSTKGRVMRNQERSQLVLVF